MPGTLNQLKLPFPPDPPEDGLQENQIRLSGLFAAVTLCAIVAAAYAQFGFWGLMAAVDVLLLAIAGLRYCDFRRACGIPLPPWSTFETVVMLGITLWLQSLLLPPVMSGPRGSGAPPTATVPAAPSPSPAALSNDES